MWCQLLSATLAGPGLDPAPDTPPCKWPVVPLVSTYRAGPVMAPLFPADHSISVRVAAAAVLNQPSTVKLVPDAEVIGSTGMVATGFVAIDVFTELANGPVCA